MKSFRTFSLAAAALLSLAASAQAADLPFRQAPAAPVAYGTADVANTWTGAYVGLNFGGIWGHDGRPTFTRADGAFGGVLLDKEEVNYTIGGTVGFNYQLGGLVAGVEADLAWANIDRKATIARTEVTNIGTFDTVGALRSEVEYWGTVRARLGYAASPSLLIYGTGGLAYADLSNSAFTATTLTTGGATIPWTASSGRDSNVEFGYTLGAGAEYAFNRNWSLKAEYLFVGLPETKYVLTTDAGDEAFNVEQKNDFSVVRGGLNYRF